MGGGRAKALADPGRGAGGSQGSRTEALTPRKAGVLSSLPGVGTKNTWDVRRKKGVSRADSLGLAPRPEKRVELPLGRERSPRGPQGEGKGRGERGQGHEEGGSPWARGHAPD